MKSSPINIVTGDILGFTVLLSIAVCVGFFLSEFQDKPLPLIYQSKEQRINEAVAQIHVKVSGDGFKLAKQLTLKDFRVFVDQKKGLIFDARPEIFYQIGHVPGALSLPRDAFKETYLKLKSLLQLDSAQPIAVYCSDSGCDDSVLVQKALQDIGYTNVAVFRGGWNQWTSENLPTAKE